MKINIDFSWKDSKEKAGKGNKKAYMGLRMVASYKG